ncbi:MAG TPA: hypothetical protein DD379_16145 [Cyanobacteria bacterium UBA11162]|nr:hypothetical protein [Cyanobacteria bacterium UBA11162]
MSLIQERAKLASLGLASCLLAGIFTPLKSEAASFALLSEGAKVISWSSFYTEGLSPVNWGLGTAVANLLSPTKTPWASNGETGFIFGLNDSNQKLTIDLGQVRNLDQIGADVSFYPNDRVVWDYFEVRVSLDNVTYMPWGLIGAKDGIRDITTPSLFINQPLQSVRYIEYGFGAHSLDYETGSNDLRGSRVMTLYANRSDEPSASVPEPTSALGLLAFAAAFASSGLLHKGQQKSQDNTHS